MDQEWWWFDVHKGLTEGCAVWSEKTIIKFYFRELL